MSSYFSSLFSHFFHFFWEFYSRLSEHWQKMRLVICFFDSRKYKNIESRPDKFHLRNKTKNDSTSAGEKGDLNILSNMRDISRLTRTFFTIFFIDDVSQRAPSNTRAKLILFFSALPIPSHSSSDFLRPSSHLTHEGDVLLAH